MARDHSTAAAALGPSLPERLARARADLRSGVALRVGDAVLGAAETLSEARAGLLLGRPGAVLAITARRAATLKVRVYDGDLARIAPPAGAGAAWARGLADPTADLADPLRGPFDAVRDGADVDALRAGIALARCAQLLPAVIAAPAEGLAAGGLSALEPGEALAALTAPPDLARVSAARVPMAVSEAGRVHVFRPRAGGPEHHAAVIGVPDPDGPVLVRLHSACFTGDVLGSLKCDCGPQLHAALGAMAREGAGVLVYLNQEGRGIGLASKMRAYALQDQGFDTVEANHRLGFEDDERDFRLGAVMLRALGIERVRLMTNNPAKAERLASEGIAVTERVPLLTPATRHNRGYLAAKRARSGHLL